MVVVSNTFAGIISFGNLDSMPYGHLITENAERQIQHYCTPLQIARQKPNVDNYNIAL